MSGNRFVPVPGTATDIGAENTTWVAGASGGIQEVTGGGLSSPQGTGVRVSGGLGGPWVVNAAGEIHKWENGSFRQMPGSASDIAANAQGDAWIIGSQGRAAQPRQRQRRR